MILDPGPPQFRPWVSGMPEGGYASSWSPSDVSNLRAEVASWPAALRDPLLVDIPGYGRPKLYAGPRADVQRFTADTRAWLGLFLHTEDAVITTASTGNIPAHEWGHLVDWSWRQRVNGAATRERLSALPAFWAIWTKIKADYPGSAAAYLVDERELFAECFSYWAHRSAAFFELAFGTSNALLLLDYFTATLPYPGMPTDL